MAEVNSPMAQVALMYKMIEQHLREQKMSMTELNARADIAAKARSSYQVRDMVKTLLRRNYILEEGVGKNKVFSWNTAAPPFTLRLLHERTGTRTPSEVKTVRTLPVTRKSDEVELAFGDTLVILGRNKASGRLRIVIEDLK